MTAPTPTPQATDEWAAEHTVLALRTVTADGTSHGGYRYDLTPGAVNAAPDWNAKPECGGGLHVLVEAQGNWGLLDWSADAKALIVRVRRDEIVHIDAQKAKVPRLRVERVTTLASALCALACDAATITRIVDETLRRAKDGASSGYGSRLASSEYGSRLASSGYGSQLASSGNDSRLASSGYGSQLASSGYGSQLASSGDDSRLASSGDDSLILGAYGATAKAGKGGCIALAWKTKTGKPRVSVGYVGDDLKPDTWYRVNDRGAFVEVRS